MRGRRLLLAAMIMIQTLSFMVPAVSGEEQGTVDPHKDTGSPPLELLEFLGEWETKDGEWIDPIELEQWPLPDQEQEKNEDSHP